MRSASACARRAFGPGDEVLIQANAFVAAVEALVDCGARPVPVDIRLDDLGPDPEHLAALGRPRAPAPSSWSISTGSRSTSIRSWRSLASATWW